MERRRHHQQVVESERPSYARRSAGNNERFYIFLAFISLCLILVGGAVLGILSIIDAARGHPGSSWQHFTAWVDSIKGWILLVGAGVIAIKIGLPVLEIRSHTAVERAEAARIRESTRHLREARNMRHPEI
jgi:hypothetical protein